jgi:homoserine kinase
MQQITVRVPGSTSNLGPGYDCLGVALRIYNTVIVSRLTSRGQVHPPIVSEAANRFFRQVRRRPFSFSCSVAEQIPRSRGLGSSATIRLGVLLALNRFCDNALDPLKLFQLCAELEGHPDNAAPATFGGFTVVNRASAPADGKDVLPVVQRFEVSARLHFVLFIPDFEIQTVRARNVLPSKISHAAAVENCANACALTAAFVSQDYEQLRGVFADQLHQPFRVKLIPFLPRVLRAAAKAGALGGFLSGSGSTIGAVTVQSATRIAAAMARSAKTPGRTIITQADNRGARLFRSPITHH